MALNRQEKEAVVTELKAAFQESRGVFVADYRGLSVEQVTKLRAKMRESGGQFRVVKNTLLRLASKETDYEGLTEYFIGTTAVVTAPDDAVSAAKVLKDFAKEVDKLQIRGGGLGTRKMSKAEVEALAELPSLDQLRGKLVGIMQAPAQKIMGILQAPGRDIAAVLKAYAEKQ